MTKTDVKFLNLIAEIEGLHTEIDRLRAALKDALSFVPDHVYVTHRKLLEKAAAGQVNGDRPGDGYQDRLS